jgi:hypothetical protein
MKRILYFIAGMLLILGSMSACKTIEHVGHTEYVYIHDSIVIVDTTYIPVHIVDHAMLDSVGNLFTGVLQAYDSLQNEEHKKDSLLRLLGMQIVQGYNSDTLEVCSDVACARSAIVESQLCLWLEQFPIDTNLMMLSYSTYVNTLQMLNNQETKTIIIKKKFYEDPWFYISIILALVIGFGVYLKFATGRIL